MVDSPWGPLPESDVEFPVRRGKFIDVEVIGSLSAGGTITGGSITGGTITGSTVDGGTIIGSVFYSDNWVSGGGAVPLSLPDSSATTGFAIDGSAGIAQFKNIYADAGELGDLDITGTLELGTGGVFQTAASGARFVLDENAFGGNTLAIYSGIATEYANGSLQSLPIAGTTATVVLQGIRVGDATNNSSGQIGLSADATGSTSSVNAISQGNRTATATIAGVSSGTGDATTNVYATNSSSGDAEVALFAISTSGTSTISLSADKIVFHGGWQTFTPTLIASTTSPTLGTGSSAEGRYQVIGNVCIVQMRIVFGSSGTSAGSGTYSVRFASAPAISSSELSLMTIGQGEVFESGVAAYNVLARADTSNSDRVTLRFQQSGSSASSPVTDAAPLAWGANDSINVQIMYEID